MTLGKSKVRIKNGLGSLRAVFAEVMRPKGDKNDENSGNDSEEEELGNYDDNWYSDHAKNQEEMLSKIKRYLTTKNLLELGVITTD